MDIIQSVKRALDGAKAEVRSIGKSVCGNDILCAHCGSYSGAQVIITAAIHARECYTANVVLNQITEFPHDSRGGIYFVPLVNPDGAAFFESGNTFGSVFLGKYAHMHRQWKANARGVDLNCNFDANFGTGVQNTHTPGAHGYIGEYPLCAPESKALADFTLAVRPAATVSYHCMGGELYWEFFQRGEARRRDLRFAAAVAKKIGVKKVDGDLDSAGGYKDWCVQKLHIPAVTVELIKRGTHPFSPQDFEPDIELNGHLPEFILDYLNGENNER